MSADLESSEQPVTDVQVFGLVSSSQPRSGILLHLDCLED